MNRFPMVATILKTLMPGAIEKLVADTKTHEAHTIELIERSVIEVPLVECDESDELIGFARRVNNPTDRPDFLTRILEDRDIKQISNVQLAAHASDFV